MATSGRRVGDELMSIKSHKSHASANSLQPRTPWPPYGAARGGFFYLLANLEFDQCELRCLTRASYGITFSDTRPNSFIARIAKSSLLDETLNDSIRDEMRFPVRSKPSSRALPRM